MLSVANLTRWNNYFNQSAIKNCDIHIYRSNGNLILDKSHIESFNLTMRNCYVCKEIPSDVCLIKIIKWNELSSGNKTYLSTKGNCIKVGYIVEGEETTTCKVLAVDKIKIDRTGTTATVSLVNPLEQLTEINEYIYGGGYISNENPPFSYGAYAVSGAYPLNSTTAECIQLFALDQSRTTAKGFRVITVNKNYDFRLDNYLPYDSDNFIDFDANNISTFFSYNNLIDYEFTVDEEGNDTIKVYGATLGNTVNYRSDTIPTGSSSFEWNYYFEEEVKVYEVICYERYDEQLADYFAHLYNNKMRFWWVTDPTPDTYLWYVIRCNKLELKNITNGVTNYIQSKAFLEDYVPAIQSSIRSYYANKDLVSIECRINPIFEPLDIITIMFNGELKTIALEEVSIKFNGGYMGSMSGRIVGTNQLSAPQVQFNINYADFNAGVDNSYSFVITNNNPVPVTFQMEAEGTAFSYSTTIPANSSVTLRSTTELTGRFDGTVLYRDRNIVGTFSYESATSPQTTLLAEVTNLSAPVIVKSIDSQHRSIDVTFTNNNDCMVDLRCEGSDSTEPYSNQLRPHTSITVSNDEMSPNYDESFATSIDDMLWLYLLEDLGDDYYCYYRASNGVVSDNTIILEAN